MDSFQPETVIGEYIGDYETSRELHDMTLEDTRKFEDADSFNPPTPEVDETKRFPRAACVIDILRASVAFDSADQILEAFRILKRESGVVTKVGATQLMFAIVRYKNKYRANTPMPFRNLMVNVQVDLGRLTKLIQGKAVLCM